MAVDVNELNRVLKTGDTKKMKEVMDKQFARKDGGIGYAFDAMDATQDEE